MGNGGVRPRGMRSQETRARENRRGSGGENPAVSTKTRRLGRTHAPAAKNVAVTKRKAPRGREGSYASGGGVGGASERDVASRVTAGKSQRAWRGAGAAASTVSTASILSTVFTASCFRSSAWPF